jgi:hypothetical protein
VTEPLRSELIWYLGEVCILFRTAWEHQRSRYPLMDDPGGGVGVCPEAAGASRWWEFVGLRVGVATNVGRSVYIVERHDVKDFRTLGPPWSRKQPKGLSWCTSYSTSYTCTLYRRVCISFLWGPTYTKSIQMGPTLYIFLVGNCIRYTVPIQSVYHRASGYASRR